MIHWQLGYTAVSDAKIWSCVGGFVSLVNDRRAWLFLLGNLRTLVTEIEGPSQSSDFKIFKIKPKEICKISACSWSGQ